MKTNTSLRLVFMGTSEFAIPILEALYNSGHHIQLVVSQPDRPRGRKQQLAATPVKELSQQLGLALYQPDKIRESACITQLSSLKPDLIVTASFGQILSQKVLSVPLLGTLNVHASLLPKLRGASPIQSAIIQGHSETGVTIMLTEKGLDTGPIVSQKSIDILNDDTAGTLQVKLAELGADLLIRTIPDFTSGQIKPIVQDCTLASYAPLLSSQDGWIDWTRSAREIAFQIRGMNPCPGAYTSCGNQRLKIHFAQSISYQSTNKPAGTVIGVQNGKGAIIQTGNGVLICEEIQPACRKRMTGDNLILGRFAAINDVLGQNPNPEDTICRD